MLFVARLLTAFAWILGAGSLLAFGLFLGSKRMKVLVPQCFQSLRVKTFCGKKKLGRASSERQALNPSANRAGLRPGDTRQR